MLSNLLRKPVRYLLFNDVAKLCLGTAAGFAIIGSAGMFANHFVPGTTRLNELTWISIFYLILGFVEPLRATRFANKKLARLESPTVVETIESTTGKPIAPPSKPLRVCVFSARFAIA